MTARLKWLAGGFAFAFVALFLWLLLAANPKAEPDHASRPAMCELAELCDTARPSPVDLRPAPLARDDPDRSLVARTAGGGAIQAYLPLASRPTPNRLFLVQGSALVVVRNLAEGRRALLVRRAAGLAASILRTDAELDLARFALLDPVSGSGDTFVLRQAPGSLDFAYRVVAPDSPEIRAEWLASRRSSCGGGPLTEVPQRWRLAYDAACRSGSASRGGAG